MKDICQWVNSNCLVMYCCTQKCDRVKTEIYNRLLEFKYYTGDDYDIVYNEMLENRCCPICSNDKFYLKPLNNKEYILDCVDCQTGLVLRRDSIFTNKFIKYKLTNIFSREGDVTWSNVETHSLTNILKKLNIIIRR